MTLVRRVARPMLSTIFVIGGTDSLRNASKKTAAAEKLAPVLEKIPYLPRDSTTLVRLNAAAMLAGGLALALGRFPRIAALVLAGTLLPTTVGAHAFWSVEDPTARAMQRTQFAKNLSLMGGLLLAAVDTGGKPGLTWRAKHGVSSAKRTARFAGKAAKREAKLMALSASGHLPH